MKKPYTQEDQKFWDAAYLAALPVFVARNAKQIDHEDRPHRIVGREDACLDAAAIATESVSQRLKSMESRKAELEEPK